MSQDDIIAMASAAGIWIPLGAEKSAQEDALERFAAMVAAAEREACAALIESTTERCRWIRGGINGEAVKPCEYAAAIRARGTP